MYYAIIALIVISIFLIIIAFLPAADKRPRLVKKKAPVNKIRGPAYPAKLIKGTSTLINKPFAKMPYMRTLQDHIDFLKLPMGAIELLLIKEFVGIVLGIVVFKYVSPAYGILAAFFGFLFPDMFLSAKIRRKKEEIVKYFPETVDLLDLCIGAGLDFMSSVRWVVEKSYGNPFIEELKVILNDIRVGKSRTQALKETAVRLKIPDISSFVRTIVQAEKMGVSIEEALRNLSEDTRDMRYQMGERQAIKASLKILIPLLFCILPVILIVVAGPVIIRFTTEGLFPDVSAGGG